MLRRENPVFLNIYIYQKSNVLPDSYNLDDNSGVGEKRTYNVRDWKQPQQINGESWTTPILFYFIYMTNFHMNKVYLN